MRDNILIPDELIKCMPTDLRPKYILLNTGFLCRSFFLAELYAVYFEARDLNTCCGIYSDYTTGDDFKKSDLWYSATAKVLNKHLDPVPIGEYGCLSYGIDIPLFPKTINELKRNFANAEIEEFETDTDNNDPVNITNKVQYHLLMFPKLAKMFNKKHVSFVIDGDNHVLIRDINNTFLYERQQNPQLEDYSFKQMIKHVFNNNYPRINYNRFMKYLGNRPRRIFVPWILIEL